MAGGAIYSTALRGPREGHPLYLYKKNKNLEIAEPKEKFFVSSINVNELNVEELIPLEEVTQELIYQWLEKSIHPDNLLNFKKASHEAFNPEIKYYNMDYFKVNP